MELMTISEVSKSFSVSTRTLRYYEHIGLIQSQKKENYAYRTYDETAVRRLQQIIILRKLRISLKQISLIYNDEENSKIIDVFQTHLEELDNEILSLQTIRTVTQSLLTHLKIQRRSNPHFDPLNDAEVLKVIETLSLSKSQFKEEQSMKELQNAHKFLSKLSDVRVVHLPPCTVAAYCYVGDNPEEASGEVIERFVKDIKLYEIKPDARMFGFNSPNPSPDRPFHGYESWVTIPDDLNPPHPLKKRQFSGGLYAAHKIAMGDFHEWEWLKEWVKNSDKYKARYSKEGESNMNGCLEEHLNWVYYSYLGWPDSHEAQLDLLLPIQLK